MLPLMLWLRTLLLLLFRLLWRLVLLETEERLKLRSIWSLLVDTCCDASSLVDVLELCPVALGTSFLVVLELCPVAWELRSPWSLLVDSDDKLIVPSSSSSSSSSLEKLCMVPLRTFSLIVSEASDFLFIPDFPLIDIIFEGMITITWEKNSKIQKYDRL